MQPRRPVGDVLATGSLTCFIAGFATGLCDAIWSWGPAERADAPDKGRAGREPRPLQVIRGVRRTGEEERMFQMSGGELLMMLILAPLLLIPIGICVWAVVTLRRVRAGHEAVLSRLDAIEQALRRLAPSV